MEAFTFIGAVCGIISLFAYIYSNVHTNDLIRLHEAQIKLQKAVVERIEKLEVNQEIDKDLSKFDDYRDSNGLFTKKRK